MPKKAAAVLVAVVVSAAALGGLASNRLIDDWMTQTQSEEAERLANTLRLMSARALQRRDVAALHRVADEFLRYENVLAVSILDGEGRQLAYAGHGATRLTQEQNDHDTAPSLGMAYAQAVSRERLLAGRPVVSEAADDGTILGAVRIALDTRRHADRLRQAQTTMALVICGIVLGFLPLSQWLIGRVLITPIQRLAKVTARLADGDYDARAQSAKSDEIGLLAHSFNTMAEKIQMQHAQLRAANESLETKVRKRTAELDAANAKLRADMAEREEFLRVVSHDLNAPLRNIGGMASIILMKWADALPAQVVERLERIQANVEAETGLIGDLLELSRIGARPANPENVDAREVLESVRSSLSHELQQRNIELRAGPLPVLYIERNHLRQVLMNLVDNAVKYMGPRDDARIEVTCDRTVEAFVFHVADNGVGIAPEDQTRVFTIFRRARDAAAVAPGKGVGLAGVSAIASKYQGRAWVDSEPGAGSTFHVSFARTCCEAPMEGNVRNDAFSEEAAVAGHLVG